MPAYTNVRTKDKSRAKISCLPCRRLKHKCDGDPEQSPCPRCISRQVECLWPTEDKRTTRFRPDKADLTNKTDDLAIGQEGGQASQGAGGATEPSVATTDSTTMPMGADSEPMRHAPEHDNMWLDWLVGNSVAPFATSSDLLSEIRSDEQDWPSSLVPVTLDWAPAAIDGSGSSESFRSTGYAFPSSLPQSSRALNIGGPSSRIIRIKWFRPHGRTAFETGILPMTLDVMLSPNDHGTIETAPTTYQHTSSVGGVTDTALKKHLIDLFETRFGAEFPYVDLKGMRDDIDAERGSQFLLLAVCGLAARFSEDPILAKPGLAPSEYGESYIEQAKTMIGSMMAVPVRETVIGFILLTYGISWKGSTSEFWMLSGMAIRLAVDMGLHLSPAPGTSDDDARKDRLVFWSVMALDLAVSFGVGRMTTISPLSVTQPIPCLDASGPLPSPLVHLAGLIVPLAQINNALNLDDSSLTNTSPNVDFLKGQVAGMYGSLPAYMAWSTQNLRNHAVVGQATIFLVCHLWVHAILLTHVRSTDGTATSEAIPLPTIKPCRSQDALGSAEAICEMMTACEVFQPEPYLMFPFISQALYNAALVFIEVIEDARQSTHGPTVGIRVTRALAKLAIIQNVFVQLGRYWPGCKLIASAVEQRIAGQEHISFVSDDTSSVVPRVIGAGLLPTRFAGNAPDR